MVLESLKGRLVVDERMANVKSAFGTLKSGSAIEAVYNLAAGFGHNNRKLLGLR